MNNESYLYHGRGLSTVSQTIFVDVCETE